jgi:hypothetical protein
MDKVMLKKYIKSFATNVALAAMMGTLALTYIPLVIEGRGYLILAICDIICFIADTNFAIRDWKKIKTMLKEEKVDVEE